MERLISGEPENADELILEHDNKDSPAIATIGIVDKPDWDQLSNSRFIENHCIIFV